MDVGATTTATVSNLTPGVVYYFAVTAYDSSGNESMPSSEVNYVAAAASEGLANVSTRTYVRTGDNVLIGGLIISGNSPKRVLIRATGPSLVAAGLTNALSDPVLQLYDSAGTLIATNDNWISDWANVQFTGLAPLDNSEAAVVLTLPPGAYTAVISGAGGTEGVALFELYDLDPANSRIVNISSRSRVETGDNVMIGGFIIGGSQSNEVVVRAIGPSMAAQGVADALSDPSLSLYDANGSEIFGNDNWMSAQGDQIMDSGLAPTDPRESAIRATLPPGGYTAVVRGINDSTGVALVEVYNITP